MSRHRRRFPWPLALLIALLAAPAGFVGTAGAQTDSRLLEALGLGGGAPGASLPQAPDYGLPETVTTALRGEPGAALSATALLEGPVDPARYRLGPGDELLVNYRGRTSVTHRLLVLPEGSVYLPDVGAVPLSGRTLEEGRRLVRAAAQKILNNVAVDVQLARVRTFKVAIRGEVRRPGSYAVTGATRLLELIQLAGGAGDSAAIRSIVVGPSTNGAPGAASRVDLLPFLLGSPEPASNPFLLDGQSVFVPRRERSVVVLGSVSYPGRYDLPEGGTTLGALLDLVGVTPDAAVDRIELLEFGPEGAGPTGGAPEVRRGTRVELAGTPLHDGARVLVPGTGDYRRAEVATVEGDVRHPGSYAIGPEGARTPAGLVERAGGFVPGALATRVRLLRIVTADSLAGDWRRLAQFPQVPLTPTERERLHSRGGTIRAVLLDLSAPGGAAGALPLAPGDRLVVPRATGAVEVAGRVRRPGFYPWRAGADADDYIADAGGTVSHAEVSKARLAIGGADAFLLARDAGTPQPGDRIWVPERAPRNGWAILRDAVIVLGQVATIYLVIDQSTN